MRKQTSSLVLMAVLCTSLLAGASAEPNKQERLFVTGDAQGHVTSVTDAIRLQNPDALSELADETILSNIQITGENVQFTQNGKALTFKAGGADVNYQGTSDQKPPVIPAVTMTLDGKELAPADLSGAAGHLSMSITYDAPEKAPFLALSALPVMGGGVSGITVDHGTILESGSRQVIVGFALLGVDLTSTTLDLADSITIEADVDHPDIKWMMSVVTADPLSSLADQLDDEADELQTLLRETTASLDALHSATKQPDYHDKVSDAFNSIRQLVDGTAALSEGASSLKEGIGTLKDGIGSLYEGAGTLTEGTGTFVKGMQDAADGAGKLADGSNSLKNGVTLVSAGAGQVNTGANELNDGLSTLNQGLATLDENSAALNQGAAEIFKAILDTANQSLAAAAPSLEKNGIVIPELTADNYHEVLSTILDTLSPDGIRALAEKNAEEQVAKKVEENTDKITAGVTEAVQAKVLEGVLAAADIKMDAESYLKAAEAGQIPEDKQNLLTAAVEEKMKSPEIAAAIENEVKAQKESLIQENMQSEDVQKQIKAAVDKALSNPDAQTVTESLKDLLGRLDSVNTFVTGLKTYTDGVSQAADGSSQLSGGAKLLTDGTAKLCDGIDTLKDGAETLNTGAGTLADGMTELNAAAGKIHTGAAGLQEGAGKLSEGSAKLYDGSVTLSDGAAALDEGIHEGLDQIYGDLFPQLDGRLKSLSSVFDDLREQLKVPVTYDTLPEGYDHQLLMIIRTDF